ncbi:hypothetical protein O181_036145 [Austropuccinia psidii MF-1]|uniref:Uncharacterized protein n=1 Tax=Austropuccinia psidii MF-1 TaxID=1389203 RepID=A0A9Q3D8C9_9BASI|nr:hypothetical protein [Austropuccinia psidii MF-1]
MELCNCTKCNSQTFNCPNGPLNGRYISSRNKRKHQANDRLQLQDHPFGSVGSQDQTSDDLASSQTSEISRSEELSVFQNNLPVLVAILICWLHLFCALSWENCKLVYKFILEILLEAQKAAFSQLKQKKDLRTMKKDLQISPQIKSSVCCSICYSLYEGKNVPMSCTYQFIGNQVCNNDLFKPTTTFNSIRDKGIGLCLRSNVSYNEIGVINTPKIIYYSHNIATWIQWLLSPKRIEEEIEDWKTELTNCLHTCDIQQSMAWKTLEWSELSTKSPNSLCLAFCLFIDWFNPRGNKLAGKPESLCCLVLSCLNLPPKYRNKPAFTLLYSIIPGPNSPDVVTISNVLKPLVDKLLLLRDGNKVLKSFHPEGQFVFAQLLPLVGDHVAIHKTVGFGNHSEQQLCAWCKAETSELHQMKVSIRRNRFEIHEAARK